MSQLNRLVVPFEECRGLSSEQDVRDLVQLLGRFGLLPSVGERPGRPPDDLEAHLATCHSVLPRPVDGLSSEMWILRLVRLDQPWIRAEAYISRLGDRWSILLSVFTPSHKDQGLSLEEFGASWGALLEAVGDALYARARPSVALIAAPGPDDEVGAAKALAQRRLLVGWRSWYGPPYVEAFGREWLLGLPDRARPLADGGVAQALDAELADLLRGADDPYARLWPYLRAAGVRPAWPRPARRPRRPTRQEQTDARLTAFRRAVRGLLETTIQLGDRRVKLLPLDWGALGRAERLLALESVREAVAADLAAEPAGRLHLEVSELPADLQALLDQLARDHEGRLSYALVPELAPPATARPAEH